MVPFARVAVTVLSEGSTGVEPKDFVSFPAINLPPSRGRSRLSAFSGIVMNAKDPIRTNARGTARSKSLAVGKTEEVVAYEIGICTFSVIVIKVEGDGGSDVDVAMTAKHATFPHVVQRLCVTKEPFMLILGGVSVLISLHAANIKSAL